MRTLSSVPRLKSLWSNGTTASHDWDAALRGRSNHRTLRSGYYTINCNLMRIWKFISRTCDYGLTRDVGSEPRITVDRRSIDQSASSEETKTGKAKFLLLINYIMIITREKCTYVHPTTALADNSSVAKYYPME